LFNLIAICVRFYYKDAVCVCLRAINFVLENVKLAEGNFQLPANVA